MPHTTLIAAILEGRWQDAIAIDRRIGTDRQELYSAADWQEAAQYALDGDYTELEYMLHREDAFQAFQAWQAADFDRREFDDFEDWASRMMPERLAA